MMLCIYSSIFSAAREALFLKKNFRKKIFSGIVDARHAAAPCAFLCHRGALRLFIWHVAFLCCVRFLAPLRAHIPWASAPDIRRMPKKYKGVGKARAATYRHVLHAYRWQKTPAKRSRRPMRRSDTLIKDRVRIARAYRCPTIRASHQPRRLDHVAQPKALRLPWLFRVMAMHKRQKARWAKPSRLLYLPMQNTCSMPVSIFHF